MGCTASTAAQDVSPEEPPVKTAEQLAAEAEARLAEEARLAKEARALEKALVETAELAAEAERARVAKLAAEAKVAEEARVAAEAKLAAEAWVAKEARLAKEARALEKALVKTAEQLVAEAELAELRRLTPGQEAAAAKAAQRIGEVAVAAEAVPEEERTPTLDYNGIHWDRFGGGAIESLIDHTPLIDLEYLIALIEGGGVMPCGRQNVPPAAFITARNLWRLKLWGKAGGDKYKYALGVLVLSYPWLDWFHPDRLGAQLYRLLPFLKAMLAEAKRDSPHCAIGVMVDFLCLPQKPFATEEDGARFLVSLKAINGWYFHEHTYTLLVTDPPPEGAAYSNTRLHRDRGWCFFEQAASMVIKSNRCLLDFGAYKGATEFMGRGVLSDPPTCLVQMKAGRAPPIAPDAFGERMRARVASGELKFTSNADMDFVIGQYEAGFVAAINRVAAEPDDTHSLVFQELGWGDNDAAELLLALRYAAAKCAFPEGAVEVAVLFGNHFSEVAKATLPPIDDGEYSGDFTGEHAEWKGKFFRPWQG